MADGSNRTQAECGWNRQMIKAPHGQPCGALIGCSAGKDFGDSVDRKFNQPLNNRVSYAEDIPRRAIKYILYSIYSPAVQICFRPPFLAVVLKVDSDMVIIRMTNTARYAGRMRKLMWFPSRPYSGGIKVEPT